MNKMKITWKRDSGDHQETYDSYMWINGKPTDNCISPCSGVYYAYLNNRQIGMADSAKEAKEMIMIAGGYAYER